MSIKRSDNYYSENIRTPIQCTMYNQQFSKITLPITYHSVAGLHVTFKSIHNVLN